MDRAPPSTNSRSSHGRADGCSRGSCDWRPGRFATAARSLGGYAMNLPGALLRFFFNGALRLHAARRAHVANVHEMVGERSVFFWLHRLMTAGTVIDRRVAAVACVAINPYIRLLSAV